MTTATTSLKVERVALDAVTISGRVVDWETMIHAATQDRVGRDIDHRGMVTRPNDETELASVYRGLLCEALPMVRAAETAAYNDYCASSATTRGGSVHAAGHGSWVQGPDGAKQAAWREWQTLVAKITAAK